MTDDDKRKTNEGWDGRGAHTPTKGLAYQEALDEEMKRRKEWAERDKANGTEYVWKGKSGRRRRR